MEVVAFFMLLTFVLGVPSIYGLQDTPEWLVRASYLLTPIAGLCLAASVLALLLYGWRERRREREGL